MPEATGDIPAPSAHGIPQTSRVPASEEMLRLPPIATPAASAVSPTPAVEKPRKQGDKFLPSMQQPNSPSTYYTGERSPWDEGD